MTVERLFLAVPRGCLRFVIVVFPDHTHLIFFYILWKSELWCLSRVGNYLRPSRNSIIKQGDFNSKVIINWYPGSGVVLDCIDS